MRHKLLLALLLAGAVFLLGNLNGALPENTGAPGDLTCGRAPCHNVPANAGPAQLSLQIDSNATHYQADSLYMVKIKISGQPTNRNGFQLLALDQATANAGHWMLAEPAKMQIKAGISYPQRRYVTHRAPGNQQTEWTVPWKAPSTGQGVVVFYASVLASNDNGANTGDQVYTAVQALSFSPVVSEAEPVAGPLFRVFPVPAHRQMWVENSGAPAGLEVVMMDLAGQVRGTFQLEQGLNRLDISHVAPGVYILASGPAGRPFCQKVVIE